MEREILVEIANNIGNDNKSVEELIDTIMKSVERWAKEHKGELKKLTPEQRERLTQPTYLVRQIAEVKYAEEKLRRRVYENLKRAQGNLGEEERMLGLYDTLEKFNYSCPYSDTLLIGGEQPIHIDHIIPATMGGPTDDWNCIPVCGSCNQSKNDRHLLDWWNDNRTAEEEYKLVKIFEHITSKLLDNSNQIRYVKTEDNIKHLDVITFLNQLLDHIEQNKQYILGPNTSILDDNTKAIESKLKELKKTFEQVVKKNSDKTLKTDKQYFIEQKEMLKYVKDLGVASYYKVAYNYFDEIQEMLNQGTSEEEIRQFCFDRDDSFNFTLFYEKLDEYKQKFGNCLVPNAYVCDDGYRLGSRVATVRTGKNKISDVQKQTLKDMGFAWIVKGFDADGIRVELKNFVEKYKEFGKKPKQHNKPTKLLTKDEQEENNLYGSWKNYTNIKNLNPKEIEYLINNGIKLRNSKQKGADLDGVRFIVKDFIEKYIIFVNTHHKHPQAKGSIEGESALYSLWIKYTNPKNINEEEKQFIINNIDYHELDNIRLEVKDFVKRYLNFVNSFGRRPYNDGELERNLYGLWTRYTNPKNINSEEERFLINNGFEMRHVKKKSKDIDNIRFPVKRFVEKYLKFVNTYHKHPQQKGNIEDEDSLYQLWITYANPENLNKEEQQFLIDNGIKMRKIQKVQDNIRPCIKEFIEEYLELSKKLNKLNLEYGDFEHNPLLRRKWLKYTDKENLSSEEERYILKHGLSLREVKRITKSADNIRESLKQFVKEYLDFISNYNKRPEYNGKGPKEQSLYDRWRKFTGPTSPKKLNSDEITYLQQNGIEVRGLEEMQETKTKIDGGLGL